MKPSIGRIVHFVAMDGPKPEPTCRAAIVTAVAEPGDELIEVGPDGQVTTVHLCVFGLNGQSFLRYARLQEAKLPGTWHWPERVS